MYHISVSKKTTMAKFLPCLDGLTLIVRSVNTDHLYTPCSLHSASDTPIFCVPRLDRRTLGGKSFQYTGPVIWKSLPLSVRHSSSLFFLVKTESLPLPFSILIRRFPSSHSTNPSPVTHVFAVCVCVCVCVRACVCLCACV